MEPAEEVTFQLLREMTDDFSSERKLGEGSFGKVYRGVTHAGEDVAVKMLKGDFEIGVGWRWWDKNENINTVSKQFKNEIYHLGMLRHQNIVQILGYCYEVEKKRMVYDGNIKFIEEQHRAICLEYLHNGSLQNHLSDEFGGLDWDTRFKIIKGTCEGLKYFHHDLEEHLYHLDLKPDNILLDKDMAPKIADFGLSMIFGKELKTTTTQYPLGTIPYVPPECIDRDEVSDKFDIFSLGVVMIEIMSGPKSYNKCADMSSDEFANQVQENWRQRLQATYHGSLLEMYCHQVKTCIQIALNCVEKDRQRRPDIVKITEKLNKIETDNCMLPRNGSHKNISGAAGNNNKRRKESKDIIDRHHNINLMTRPNCSELEFVDAQETSSFVVKEHIVGRDEEKMEIVTSLLEVISEAIVILPIYGIGGIGKTTLARLIYNDPKFQSYSQVWVDVTQRFDLTKIRESIFSQLSGEESCDNERQMMHRLTNLLSNKKILVVLDDLWEVNQFQLDELRNTLYNKDSNIIVLVTTRSGDVADRIYRNLQPHKILPLTNDMCWDIIKQRIGFDARDDKEQLIRIGLEIAQKCGGVALAAQSLGFTLRSMNIDQWMKIKDSDIWNLTNDLVLASLELSYSYMDSCLKTCFTYCAIFPKRHKMVKSDLVYQWISLDFIKPTRLLSVIHLCEKYIMQLLGLSFFQHSSLSPKISQEQVVRYTMHDLVHDLARLKMDDQLIDFTTQEGNTLGRQNCRYLLLNYDQTMKLASICPSEIRALRLSDSGELDIERGSIGQLRQLRCLIAPRMQNESLPECITELRKLQYVNINGSSQICALPGSIGKLGCLKYLYLSGCSSVSKLPESFGDLKCMVHLDMSGCSGLTELPESLGSLTNLQHLSLSGCSSVKVVPESLCGLKQLQYLNLSSCECLSRLPEGIGGLMDLQYLNMSGCEQIRGLPDSMMKLQNLLHLDLSKCHNISQSGEIGLQNLSGVLANLTNLEYLGLRNLIRLGSGSANYVPHWIGGMTNLNHLDLSWNTGLACLPESIGNLTSMHTLDLTECWSLKSLPESIRARPWLKSLVLQGCSLELVDQASSLVHFSQTLPDFKVRADDVNGCSNLHLLEGINVSELRISSLENVRSLEEANKVKLLEKQKLSELSLAWTLDAVRLLQDKDLLGQLVPPRGLKHMCLYGYMSAGFPGWLMGASGHLTNLVSIQLHKLDWCRHLPPLGQLPHLESLDFWRLRRVRKIDKEFCGGKGAFRSLSSFKIRAMEGLEEWNTTYSFEDGVEFMFPVLDTLKIDYCPMLKLKPCPPTFRECYISDSPQVLSSLEEVDQGSRPSSSNRAVKLDLEIDGDSCQSMRLLFHHFPALRELRIQGGGQRSLPESMQHLTSLEFLTLDYCLGISSLPEWLGDLSSLKSLVIEGCRSIESLPSCIQNLPKLQKLDIFLCSQKLKEWCESEENKAKLAYIKVKVSSLTKKGKRDRYG